MSLEIILVPLAIAAYGSWKARSMERDNVLLVETRLKDTRLLKQALHAMGGVSITVEGSKVSAEIGARKVSFSPDSQGVMAAHVDTKNHEEAISLLLEVDRQYGIQVQTAVVEKVKQRASGLGMNIVSQMVSDDGAINIVLEEVSA
jgi:hypothetical protein